MIRKTPFRLCSVMIVLVELSAGNRSPSPLRNNCGGVAGFELTSGCVIRCKSDVSLDRDCEGWGIRPEESSDDSGKPSMTRQDSLAEMMRSRQALDIACFGA